MDLEKVICEMETDPCKHFQGVREEAILNAIGVLLPWAVNTHFYDSSAKEAFDKQYSFGLFPMGGKIRDNGVFEYPGDPDMYPLVKLDRFGRETIFFYQHAIVAIKQTDGTTFITRMD